MKDMILCVFVLAIIIGAANFCELPRVGRHSEPQPHAAMLDRIHHTLTRCASDE